LSAPNPPLMKQKRQTDDEFSEWLFDPLPKGDSHASRNT
jgi:hypothetical protein